MTMLKAALNHAYDEGQTANRMRSRIRPLVRAGLETGCRYGELITLEVCDFNSDAGTLAIRQSRAASHAMWC